MWQQLHEVLLAELNAAARLDWSRAVVDSSHVQATKGEPDGAESGRPWPNLIETPPDHRRTRHTARRDPYRRQPQRRHPAHAADRCHPTSQRQDRTPATQADSLFADRGYDHDIYRDQVRQRRIVPAIARRSTLHGTGLGTYCWVVDRSFAWLHGFKRLRSHWERRADIHEAFL